MKKRIFIVHGWGGIAKEGWFAWLKEELEATGYLVFALQMPNTNEPEIKTWVETIAKSVGIVDNNTFFVSHSIGSQAVVRYLSQLQDEKSVGGAIFIAGFLKRLIMDDFDDKSKKITREWLDTPIDLIAVKKYLLKSLAIFSDDDPYVPMDNIDDFQNILNSQIIIEHQQGHFSGSSGLLKYPNILQYIIDFIGN